jgi:hypothetical protein
MKKAELTAKTVAELKALAKKKKISLPAGAKKDDIIKVLMASAVRKKTGKPDAKKPVALKRPARRAAVSGSAKKTVKEPAKVPARKWEMPVGAEEPLMAQERVAEAKFYTGPVPEQKSVPTS